MEEATKDLEGKVLEINWFRPKGDIIYSSDEGLLGWKPEDRHVMKI